MPRLDQVPQPLRGVGVPLVVVVPHVEKARDRSPGQ
jgi:hypothetical protein